MGRQPVVIVGSGLSAYGAIKACIDFGIAPTVIDVGILSPLRTDLADLKVKSPTTWTVQDRSLIRGSTQRSLASLQKIPRKLVHGSDFFYGTSNANAPFTYAGQHPPLSYAFSGLANAWGAAALPLSAQAIDRSPIPQNELSEAYAAVLSDIPYSFEHDSISRIFSTYNAVSQPLSASFATQKFLHWFATSRLMRDEFTLYGQARLLVDASPNSVDSCQYCGECMSGCIYNSIFKPGKLIKRWEEEGLLEYKPQHMVTSFEELPGAVFLRGTNGNGDPWTLECDTLILTAGAVNTTRIVLNSSPHVKNSQKATLQTRGGFLLPVFSFRSFPACSPPFNSLPSVFVEILPFKMNDWVHIQLGLDNELLSQWIHAFCKRFRLPAFIRRYASRHFFIAFVNYDSTSSSTYEMNHSKSDAPHAAGMLHLRYKSKSPSGLQSLFLVAKLFSVFSAIRCMPLLPLVRPNRSTYHVGASIPIVSSSASSQTPGLTCSPNGLLQGHRSVFIGDTASLPWLPGTTVGLTAMAHSYRIAKNIFGGSP